MFSTRNHSQTLARRTVALAIFVSFVWQLGSCSCGCFEHNAWVLMLVSNEHSIQHEHEHEHHKDHEHGHEHEHGHGHEHHKVHEHEHYNEHGHEHEYREQLASNTARDSVLDHMSCEHDHEKCVSGQSTYVDNSRTDLVGGSLRLSGLGNAFPLAICQIQPPALPCPGSINLLGGPVNFYQHGRSALQVYLI